jgi:hypothetical protein
MKWCIHFETYRFEIGGNCSSDWRSKRTTRSLSGRPAEGDLLGHGVARPLNGQAEKSQQSKEHAQAQKERPRQTLRGAGGFSESALLACDDRYGND